MAEISASDYMGAADSFLKNVEQAKLASKDELSKVREELAGQLKADALAAVKDMKTINIGGNKVVAPNLENLKRLNLYTNRAKERVSNFRLHYVDREQVAKLKEGAIPADTKQFIRHSRRMARHAREFLVDLQELEPDLEEEIQETLIQLEDNDMDLLKLEIKSFTRIRETLVRGMGGRKTKEAITKEIETFDFNHNLWNLSLVEHPAAVVKGLMANAAEVMGSRAVTVTETLPKRTLLLVAPTPDAQKRMTPSSRTAKISWRVMNAEQLDKTYEAINTGRKTSPSSWRGLGLAPNTNEFYLPVMPEIAEGVKFLARARRTALLAAIAARGVL